MTHLDRFRMRLILVVLAATAAGLDGEQRTPSGPPPSAGASLDFLAVSSDGLPVADLKADEVSLKIDGRARPLTALRFVQIAGGAEPVQGTDGAAPPFGSNEPDRSESRSIILVVDEDSFRVGTERPLREAADHFLAGLSPTDRVALVTMPYGGTKVNLTTEHGKVRASLAQIVGQASQQETATDLACRTQRTLESLVGLFEGIVVTGSPIVMFFSAGLIGPTDGTIRLAPGLGGPDSVTCDVRREVFQQVGNAASAVGARVYIIQPTTVRSQLPGLENFAGVTGGTMLPLGGAETNAFSRVTRETTGHYVADFDVEPSMRNGTPHRVELRVSRPDVTVRVRPALTLAKTVAPRKMSPRDLLRQASVFRDLPLRVSGFASQEPGQKTIRVVMVGESPGSSKVSAAAAGLFDEKGRLVGQWTARPEELSSGLILGALAVPAGSYRLRLAATDAEGRTGTADYDLEAQLTDAGPLKLSSLALGISRGSFVPKLQFAAEPVALAHVEIYGGKAGLPVTATFDVSRTVNGPALVAVPGALGAVGDHHGASGAIPIGALPPGDYVVRAVIGVEGQPAGRVVRTLRKAVN
jgi:hypothetical protein